MAIHTPNVFHNTIGCASLECASPDGMTASGNPEKLVGTATNVLTAKNINYRPDDPLEIKFQAQWMGYYFIQFNATTSGGTDKLWYFEPYKNGSALGYGNTYFYQQNIAAARVPYYEISSNFIAQLQAEDYIEFYITLQSGEAPEEELALKNVSCAIYQLEQVGIH